MTLTEAPRSEFQGYHAYRCWKAAHFYGVGTEAMGRLYYSHHQQPRPGLLHRVTEKRCSCSVWPPQLCWVPVEEEMNRARRARNMHLSLQERRGFKELEAIELKSPSTGCARHWLPVTRAFWLFFLRSQWDTVQIPWQQGVTRWPSSGQWNVTCPHPNPNSSYNHPCVSFPCLLGLISGDPKAGGLAEPQSRGEPEPPHLSH